MTPKQFTKSRAEFIKSCGKPPLHEVLGVVHDLDNLCDELLQENGNLRGELISMASITFAVIEELRSNGRELPTELAAQLQAHTQRFLENCRKESRTNIEIIVSAGIVDNRKTQAKAAINARHDKEGGSRDARTQLRAIWAQGNFSTRVDCAEQERGKFNGVKGKELSLSQAIKYLRNTPDPDPWPADPKRKG